MKLATKLNAKGFSHHILLPLAAIVIVGGVGAYIFITAQAATSYSICSKRYGGCIINHGAGKQVTVSKTTNNTYRLINPMGCGQQSAATCYEYQDVQTGRCLKAYPHVSGEPIEETACTNTSGTTKSQEEMLWTNGNMSPAYVFPYNARNDVADLNGKGPVSMQSNTVYGSLWVRVSAN
jgi:hypothetical protein